MSIEPQTISSEVVVYCNRIVKLKDILASLGVTNLANKYLKIYITNEMLEKTHSTLRWKYRIGGGEELDFMTMSSTRRYQRLPRTLEYVQGTLIMVFDFPSAPL